MIDYTKLTIEGEFPPIGKATKVEQRPGFSTESFTADTYRLFGTGADYHLKLINLKGGGQALEMAFCPPKILQGHNGLGSNDLIGVVRHAVPLIFRDRGIPLTSDLKKRLKEGDYGLREVHVTELHSMPHASIPALCQQIRRYGPDSLQAVPLAKGIGVRLWPHSRSRSALVYDKVYYFNDFTKRKPFKHLDILRAGLDAESYAWHWQAINMDSLMDYLTRGVRIEVKLFAPFLKQRKLDRGSAWTPEVAKQMHQQVLEEVPLGDMPLVSAIDDAIAKAPLALRILIALWADGRDPRAFATANSTFHAQCKRIEKQFDLDISRPLIELPAPITWPMLIAPDSIVERAPQWARGDGFFFSPMLPKRAAVQHRGETRR